MGYYSIGKTAEITGLSIQTLRYYDNIGLLSPSYVDKESNYRYYDSNQFWRIEIIKICKKMNIPLKQIKNIMNADNNNDILQLMKTQRMLFEEKLKSIKTSIENIKWYEEQYRKLVDEKIDYGVIYEKDIPERYVIYRENKYEYDDFHCTLQEASKKEQENIESVRRSYGHVLDKISFKKNSIIRKGEFLDLFKKEYQYTNSNDILKIRSGRYVCMMIRWINTSTDELLIQELNNYLYEKKYEIDKVFAVEYSQPWMVENGISVEIQVQLKK